MQHSFRAKDFIHQQDEMIQNFTETKRLSSKNFQILPPNFVKGPNKIWLKFCLFCMDESEQNEAKGSLMLKKALYLQRMKIDQISIKFKSQLRQNWQNL
jgi:hypothetical protein